MDIFLFVLGYLIQFAAAMLLFFKISKQRSVYGLSVDTQVRDEQKSRKKLQSKRIDARVSGRGNPETRLGINELR